MNKVLEIYRLSELSQEETDNLIKLITGSKILFVIKKKTSCKQKFGWLHWVVLNIQRRTYIYLSQTLPKIEKEEALPNFLCEAAITLIPKPHKDTTRKENHRPPSFTNMRTKSSPTVCDPLDCSLPGSFSHKIFQARIWEWVTISYSRGSSISKD